MEIRGVILNVLSHEADNGFASIEYESGEELFVAKMSFHGAKPPVGYSFVAIGEMKESTYRGKQEDKFVARSMRPDFPKSIAGTAAFLGRFLNDAKHGIKRVSIEKFARERGSAGLKAAVDDPEILVALSSRPNSARDAILADWTERASGGKAVSLMEASGVAETAIEAVISEWREGALQRLHVNCYGAASIPEVGFVNADLVGRHLGIGPEDRRRLAAAVGEVLARRRTGGSTATDVAEMMDALGSVSSIGRSTLVGFLEESASRRADGFRLIASPEGPICSPSDLFEAELTIARNVSRMLTSGRSHSLDTVRAAAARMYASDPKRFGRLDAVQKVAIEMAVCEPLSIVTGGPGTGKSTVMDAVAKLVETLDRVKPTMAGPTGMSAKRLEATTGRPARTLHVTLGCRGKDEDGRPVFNHGASFPLPPQSVVVVDETSMQDVVLMAALMSAVPSDGRLVLVGDPDQLESVDAGSFLRDSLSARIEGKRIIPSVRLVKSYRSAGKAAIGSGMEAIRLGRVPDIAPDGAGGVAFHDSSVKDVGADIERLVCGRLVREVSDPIREIAVLCPQASGPGGTWDLNRRLSARLNPDGAVVPGIRHGWRDKKDMPLPRVGDRVMLLDNEKGGKLANGDEGIVDAATPDERGKPGFRVSFDCGETRVYPVSKWRDLSVSFAKTIHKFQGSQASIVVMPVSASHERMNTRRLVYTGFTRAQDSIHLVGQREAMASAVRNTGEHRSTLLVRFLSALPFSSLRRPGAPDWEDIAGEAALRVEGRNISADDGAPADARPASPARPTPAVASTARPVRAPLRSMFGGSRSTPSAAPVAAPVPAGNPGTSRRPYRSMFGAAPSPRVPFPVLDAPDVPEPVSAHVESEETSPSDAHVRVVTSALRRPMFRPAPKSGASTDTDEPTGIPVNRAP